MRTFLVDAKSSGSRADVFIASKYPSFTRSALGGLFDDNLVTINTKPAKAGQKLRTGDKIKTDDKLLEPNDAELSLPVLYQDEDVIVINKPAGVLTHSKGGLNTESTVANFIKSYLTGKDLTGNRAGIVHRLDRATSGVIVTARNLNTQQWLQKQFSERKVKKTYLAVVEDAPNPKQAEIDIPIARNLKKPQTFKADPSGKAAKTIYKTLKTFVRDGQKYSLLELRPQTGRTHQLRVHLAYIKHPIVGDTVYGKTGDSLLLHASSLEVNMPGGRTKVFKAPTPKRISDFIR